MDNTKLQSKVNNLLVFLANNVAETSVYNWKMSFSSEHISNAYQKIINSIKSEIDWNNLTKENCLTLGFQYASEKEPNFMLIPIWLYNAIPEGTELITIFGKHFKFIPGKSDADNRFGYLAYGIHVDK